MATSRPRLVMRTSRSEISLTETSSMAAAPSRALSSVSSPVGMAKGSGIWITLSAITTRASSIRRLSRAPRLVDTCTSARVTCAGWPTSMSRSRTEARGKSPTRASPIRTGWPSQVDACCSMAARMASPEKRKYPASVTTATSTTTIAARTMTILRMGEE
jgi:hypothetical protein